jgi:DNA-binding NarL/FixJ family response regulator
LFATPNDCNKSAIENVNTVTPTSPIRVLIVDDHPLVRHSLCALVSQIEGWEICGQAATCDEAIKLFKSKRPHLTLVDISLAGASGLDLIKRVKSIDGNAKLLVISMHDERIYAERCLRAGAQGFIGKEADLELLHAAMEQVLGGDFFVSPAINRRLIAGMLNQRTADNITPIEQLTNRELEVFSLIGHGVSTREIADRLHLSIKTIESYRENIKRKLNMNTSAELVRRAVQWILESESSD